MLVPLDRLLYPPNMPAGLDWAVIGLWVCRFRKTPEPCDPPVLIAFAGVSSSGGDDLWRISDGRHRVTAALIAGRTHIDAELEEGRP